MRRSYRFWLAVTLVTLMVEYLGCRKSPSTTVNNANDHANVSEENRPRQAEDKGDLKLRVETRRGNAAATNHTVRTEALEKILGELNQRINLPKDIYVAFLECDSPDAFYDPEGSQVTVCYQLIDEFYDLFSQRSKDKSKLDELVKGAVASTFFHELGHALVDLWKLPITGREEDAVDQLSTLVLIEGTEDGDQMALAGALSFKLYADLTKGESKVFWDEHSLDEQRFYDTICLVFGHDEEKYGYLVENGTLPRDRAVYCAEDYGKVRHAWQQLLEPHLNRVESRPKLRLR